MHTVFVYGTLRATQSNHRLLAHASPLGLARTRKQFTLLDLGAYPALIEGGTQSVVGELYAVDDATLADLDVLEGHPDYYRRVTCELECGRRALLYVLPPHRVGRRVPIISGDWLKR